MAAWSHQMEILFMTCPLFEKSAIKIISILLVYHAVSNNRNAEWKCERNIWTVQMGTEV